jgi:hypothetical protein
MSSVVISGDTSGAITLSAPSVAGTNTITLPASTGTVVTTGSPQSGSVIQLINATYSGDTSTTSASYSSSGLYGTITPRFSTSKILVIASTNAAWTQANNSLYCRIYRGTSGQGSGSSVAANNYIFQASTLSSSYVPTTITFLDSPASTSALTYTVMNASGSGSSAGYVFGYGANNLGSITLMEIAA